MKNYEQSTGRAGFTLLELLMVVIIIAILASIALPQYLRVAERSRATEALTILGALRQSQQRFRALNGGAYANNTQVMTTGNVIDIDIPGATGGPPASGMWTFSSPNTTPNDGTATRVAGGKVININYNTGKTCSNDPQYGLGVGC